MSEKNIVLDTTTGLMWQRGETNMMTWYEALKYAKKSRVGGYNDWRLPTIEELETLISKDSIPTINKKFFPKAHANFYWSSTTDAYNTNYAWYMSFRYGYVYSYVKSFHYYVRCVRGGQ